MKCGLHLQISKAQVFHLGKLINPVLWSLKKVFKFQVFCHHHSLNFFNIFRAVCNSNKTGCSPLFQGRTLWPLQMLLPDNSSCPRWCRPSPLPSCEPLANTGSCHSSRNIRPIRHDCRWQAQAPPRVENKYQSDLENNSKMIQLKWKL